jgi:O-antigen ligase
MVQEDVTWFSTKRGSYTSIPVQVQSSRGTLRTPADPLAPTTLPHAPAQPERAALWAAAVRMIRASPLLGVGPDRYRLSYGRYTSPMLRHWDPRIFANSLPLELLADLGILGGGALLLFFVTAFAPAVPAVLRGSLPSGMAIAIVAAAAGLLVHGLVDYLLGSHAILILFWLLLALVPLVARPQRQVA